MMRLRFSKGCRTLGLVLALVLFAATSARASDKRATALAHALSAITAEDLQAGVDYIADDAMEGREAGSRGSQVVGEYLASFMRQLGFKGAGDNGTFFQAFGTGYRNVLGLLEGSDPKLKKEIVVLHAHYDHVGYGYRGSLGGAGHIHNGADDNASGVSAVLKAADAFVILGERPRRSILFAFFDAEEKGLLGSRHWVAHPTLPRENVVFAVALDMIGRLRNEHLDVYGSRCGYGLRRLLAEQNADGQLRMDFDWTVKPKSDFYPFLEQEIPSLLITTGEHPDYHRPADKPQLINSPGMQEVTRMAFQLVYHVAEAEQPPRFRSQGRDESPATERGLLLADDGFHDRLGATWFGRDNQVGAIIYRVEDDSPAERAGLAYGDRIVRFAGRAIHTADDLGSAVHTASSPAAVVLHRRGETEPRTLSVELDGPPIRVGLTWRADDAEPGTTVIVAVLPGSPAAQAGLLAGDRVLQIGGGNFADEAAFAVKIRALPGPLDLLIERRGQLLRINVPLGVPAAKRAA